MIIKKKVKSVCCVADVYPDGLKQQLYCSKCGLDLGTDIDDTSKLTITTVEEPTERKENGLN